MVPGKCQRFAQAPLIANSKGKAKSSIMSALKTYMMAECMSLSHGEAANMEHMRC